MNGNGDKVDGIVYLNMDAGKLCRKYCLYCCLTLVTVVTVVMSSRVTSSVDQQETGQTDTSHSNI